VAILERRAAGEWLVGRNAGLGDLGFDFAADWRGRRGLPDDLKPPVVAGLNAVVDR
jgi:hypothetical protein